MTFNPITRSLPLLTTSGIPKGPFGPVPPLIGSENISRIQKYAICMWKSYCHIHKAYVFPQPAVRLRANILFLFCSVGWLV